MQNSTTYEPVKVLNLCKENGLLNEAMILLDRMGNKQEAVKIVFENLNSPLEAFKYMISNTDTKNDKIWDYLIDKCLKDKEKSRILLHYIEFYHLPVIYIYIYILYIVRSNKNAKIG